MKQSPLLGPLAGRDSTRDITGWMSLQPRPSKVTHLYLPAPWPQKWALPFPVDLGKHPDFPATQGILQESKMPHSSARTPPSSPSTTTVQPRIPTSSMTVRGLAPHATEHVQQPLPCPVWSHYSHTSLACSCEPALQLNEGAAVHLDAAKVCVTVPCEQSRGGEEGMSATSPWGVGRWPWRKGPEIYEGGRVGKD